jgi:hypothetical protein
VADLIAGRRANTGAILWTSIVGAAFTVEAMVIRLRPALLATVYTGLLVALLFFVLRRLRFDRGTIAILLAGVVSYLAYLGYTSFGERNYDGAAQLDYIKYVVDHHAIPPAAHCFVCHHPPAYYVAAAGFFAFFRWSRLADPVLGVQLFSLLTFIALVVFGALTVRRLTPRTHLVRLATSLIVFWPYSFQLSVRVHNDTLACSAMVAATYFIVRWHQENRSRDVYLAAVFIALGVLTKSSAYAMLAVLLALLGWRLLRRSGRLATVWRGVVVLALVGAAGSFNTFVRVKGPATAGGLCHRVLGTACDINPVEFAGNRPFNYLYFDVKSFLREPYLVIEHRETGTQFFWNDLIKTSLFGTYNKTPDPETAYALNRHVSSIENVLLFVMTLYLVFGVVRFGRTVWKRHVVVLLVLLSSIAFLIGFRVVIPAPHHNDFRHIFHVLVPMAALYAMAVGEFRTRGLGMARFGELLAIPFVGLSIFYFLPKYDLVMRLTPEVVQRSLVGFDRLAKEGKPWDEAPNLLFEGNQLVQFDLPAPRTVSQVDVSLDNNDRYELRFVGPSGARSVMLGPKAGDGLARYVERLDPPARGVERITLRAVAGDCAYSMGHLVLR